jgi:hypothetical protein
MLINNDILPHSISIELPLENNDYIKCDVDLNISNLNNYSKQEVINTVEILFGKIRLMLNT